MFLGPKAYIGSSGGGVGIPFTMAGAGFTATFRIPSSYQEGGQPDLPQVPVTPGTGYSFGTYPAEACGASFAVTG